MYVSSLLPSTPNVPLARSTGTHIRLEQHILPGFKGRQAALNRPLRRGIQRFCLGTDEQYEEANLRSLEEYIHKPALLSRPEFQMPAVLIPLSNYFVDRNLSRLFIRISQASVDRPLSRRTTASVLLRAS
jgi:hypothetical protein